MSLRVWLPLNGSLKNQGLSDYQISVFRGTETYNNSGKIGKCFYANGTNTLKILNIIPDIYNYNSYSLCCWFYIEAQNTSHSGSGIISGGNWNNQLLNLSISDWSTDHYTKLRISGTNWNRTYSYNFALNTWYHAVVCDDGVKTYAYINGNLIGDSASSFLPTSIEGNDICIGGATYYSGMQFFGRINDVRIYDHCLSAKEVEEIAKGLVLHYKLDNGGGKNNNIKLSTIVNRGCTSFTYNKSTAEWTAVCPINSSTWGFGFYINDSSIKWAYGETWVISLEVYTPQAITWNCDINNKPDLADISSYTGNDYDITGQRKVNTNGVNGSKNLQPGWNKIWFSQTASGSTYGLSNYTTNWGIVTTSLTDPITIKLRNIKGEIFQSGEVISSTPFISNNNDLIQNNNIIYDSSGYQHNGDLIGTITNSILTPRYNVSTHFINGSYGRIQERPSICLPTDAITVNLWTRIDTWGNPISCTEGGGWNFENSSGIQFPVYVASVGYKVANSGVTPTTLGDTWHMLTGTFDKENVKIYIDGILKKTTATGSPNSIGYANNYLFLAAEASGNNTSPANSTFVGDLSDLRIYCTALTEDQIKELYNTSVTIDKNGNVYAREVQEI